MTLCFCTGCWPWPIDYLITFWSIFVGSLTLDFQGQIWNLLYLSQKWSDCHGPKSKHIDWTLVLKCDHRVWPWPWHWPWIFKVKYRICYISAKNGRLPRNKKQTYQLNLRPQMWPSDLTLAMTLNLNFQGQIWNLLYLNQKWSDYHETKKETYRLNSRTQMWSMGLTLAMTLTFEFSRWNVIVTIW